MTGALIDVQAFQKPVQLTGIDVQNLTFGLRPDEPVFFQTLLPQAKSVAVPIQNLDHVAPTIAKHEQVSGERIEFQPILDQNRQPVNCLSHIRAADGQVNICLGWKEHYILAKTWTNCLRATGSKPRSISIR